MPPLNTKAMTWAALLSKWVEFAQGSLALPTNAEGDRWRKSVAPLITLQAVTFSLREIDQLPREERAIGLVKADVLIDDAVMNLSDIWQGIGLPELLCEAEDDAVGALQDAEWLGVRELIWRGNDPLIVPHFDIEELLEKIGMPERGTLLLAQPGTYIMPGEPFAAWCDLPDDALAQQTLLQFFPHSETASPRQPRQVYRIIENDGRILRDVIAFIHDECEEGLPLLMPILESGDQLGEFTLDPTEWEQAQRGQLSAGGLEVVDLTADG